MGQPMDSARKGLAPSEQLRAYLLPIYPQGKSWR